MEHAPNNLNAARGIWGVLCYSVYCTMQNPEHLNYSFVLFFNGFRMRL